MRLINADDVDAVIFDMDGTLIDTEKIYALCWPRAMAEIGYELPYDRFLQMRSLGRPYAAAKFREWYGSEQVYLDARAVRKRLFNEYLETHPIEVKMGATELLTYLHSLGITTAIATATDYDRAISYLKQVGLDGYFDQVISATMVDEGKPSPKVYLYACERLGLSPDRCVAVEDAPNGVRSAASAGLKVIMVPDLSEPDDEMRALAWDCADSLKEIIGMIK